MRLHVSIAVGLLVLAGCNRHVITNRIILPNQYVGWARVDFEAKTPPAFDSGDTIIFRINEDGRCHTSSVMVIGSKYEFFYETPQGLRPIKEDYVDHQMNAGGITSRSDEPGYGTSWYFFIGPKEYRKKHPPSEFTSHSSPLPTPGRMSAAHLMER